MACCRRINKHKVGQSDLLSGLYMAWKNGNLLGWRRRLCVSLPGFDDSYGCSPSPSVSYWQIFTALILWTSVQFDDRACFPRGNREADSRLVHVRNWLPVVSRRIKTERKFQGSFDSGNFSKFQRPMGSKIQHSDRQVVLVSLRWDCFSYCTLLSRVQFQLVFSSEFTKCSATI